MKPLRWVHSSRNDLKAFPKEVRKEVGYALWQAQLGGRSKHARPLKGFKSAGVLEIVEYYDGSAYRVVYTVRFTDAVYALHAFQKKSKKGIKTPLPEIRLVHKRLRTAEEDYEKRQAELESKGGSQ